MKKQIGVMAAFTILSVLSGCVSNGFAAGGLTGGSLADAEISALAALGRMDEALSGPLFEGDGGADIRLAVLEPDIRGADTAEAAWLPGYVQGFLHDTFRKYSRMTLSDRQNLNRILAEQELAANGRFSDTGFISMTNLTNAEYFLTGNIQKLPGGVFSVSLSITGLASGESRASFMQTGTAEALRDGTLISSAAEDLLAQMGVRLTETGRRSLRTGRYMAARAAAGFARGLAAQESGAAVEALLNYSQAAAFDPSRIESLARLGSISSEISGGSVSANILGDIQARNAWLDAFREAAAFFNSHPPFEITYDPNLVQTGQTDYARNQADLAMWIQAAPSEAGFAALNALVEGLEKTGKREAWGFAGWPLLDINPRIPGTTLFSNARSFSFTVQTALVNEQGKVIAQGNITLKTGEFLFKAGDKLIAAPAGALGQIAYPKVNVLDLTPTLTVVIAGVNQMSGRQISETGYMRIAPGEVTRQIGSFTTPAQYREMVSLSGGTIVGNAAYYYDSSNDRYKGVFIAGRTVTLNDFKIAKYETTYELWYEVYQWAAGNGYRIASPGREGENGTDGAAPTTAAKNEPVTTINWRDAVVWCNAYSEMTGKEPVYYTDNSYSTVLKTSTTSSGTGTLADGAVMKAGANGYRLPTEAEWEYAARGGGPASTSGSFADRWAGTNTGMGNYAWYSSNAGNATHPVGTKTANGAELYDMSGNVYEWCWDRYGTISTGTAANPAGPATGSYRVFRGGSWSNIASLCAVVYRGSSNLLLPGYGYNSIGLRVVCL
jgi:formylglycine-generating enzyme required for sulfatase activity